MIFGVLIDVDGVFELKMFVEFGGCLFVECVVVLYVCYVLEVFWLSFIWKVFFCCFEEVIVWRLEEDCIFDEDMIGFVGLIGI